MFFCARLHTTPHTKHTETMHFTLSLLISAFVGVIIMTVTACGPESGSLKEAANKRNAEMETIQEMTP